MRCKLAYNTLTENSLTGWHNAQPYLLAIASAPSLLDKKVLFDTIKKIFLYLSMANKQQQQKKEPLTLKEINEELIQLSDLAQAVNARCFFLREELKQNHNATT